MFSCEICEIFKNIFFTEHLRWRFLESETTSQKGNISASMVALKKLDYSRYIIDSSYKTYLKLTANVSLL